MTGGQFTKDSRYLRQETADYYDVYGRVKQLTDARNNVALYDYGGNTYAAFLTRVTRVWNSGLDLFTELRYDTKGYVDRIRDEGGSFRHFVYDTFGRLTEVRNHGNVLVTRHAYTYSRTSANGWTFQYQSPNAVATTSFVQQSPSPQSVLSTAFVDGLGRPIQTVVENGSADVVTTTQYDLMGRPWRAWKPYTGATSSYVSTSMTDATTFYNSYHGASAAKPYVETLYRPDALGRVSKIFPEYIGASPTITTVTGYGVDVGTKQVITEVTDEAAKKVRSHTDLFGNTVKTILGYGSTNATTTFEYNVLGQRTKATDPRGLNTTYTYGTRGILTAKTSPDAGTVQSKYDQAGNLRYAQDANQAAAGQVHFATYDFANRPLVSGQGAASFSSLNPFTSAGFETTTGNWLVVRAYDAKPTNVFPWSEFWTQISPLSLSNVTGRLTAVASKSNGSWQVTLFSYL